MSQQRSTILLVIFTIIMLYLGYESMFQNKAIQNVTSTEEPIERVKTRHLLSVDEDTYPTQELDKVFSKPEPSNKDASLPKFQMENSEIFNWEMSFNINKLKTESSSSKLKSLELHKKDSQDDSMSLQFYLNGSNQSNTEFYHSWNLADQFVKNLFGANSQKDLTRGSDDFISQENEITTKLPSEPMENKGKIFSSLLTLLGGGGSNNNENPTIDLGDDNAQNKPATEIIKDVPFSSFNGSIQNDIDASSVNQGNLNQNLVSETSGLILLSSTVSSSNNEENLIIEMNDSIQNESVPEMMAVSPGNVSSATENELDASSIHQGIEKQDSVFETSELVAFLPTIKSPANSCENCSLEESPSSQISNFDSNPTVSKNLTSNDIDLKNSAQFAEDMCKNFFNNIRSTVFIEILEDQNKTLVIKNMEENLKSTTEADLTDSQKGVLGNIWERLRSMRFISKRKSSENSENVINSSTEPAKSEFIREISNKTEFDNETFILPVGFSIEQCKDFLINESSFNQNDLNLMEEILESVQTEPNSILTNPVSNAVFTNLEAPQINNGSSPDVNLNVAEKSDVFKLHSTTNPNTDLNIAAFIETNPGVKNETVNDYDIPENFLDDIMANTGTIHLNDETDDLITFSPLFQPGAKDLNISDHNIVKLSNEISKNGSSGTVVLNLSENEGKLISNNELNKPSKNSEESPPEILSTIGNASQTLTNAKELKIDNILNQTSVRKNSEVPIESGTRIILNITLNFDNLKVTEMTIPQNLSLSNLDLNKTFNQLNEHKITVCQDCEPKSDNTVTDKNVPILIEPVNTNITKAKSSRSLPDFDDPFCPDCDLDQSQFNTPKEISLNTDVIPAENEITSEENKLTNIGLDTSDRFPNDQVGVSFQTPQNPRRRGARADFSDSDWSMNLVPNQLMVTSPRTAVFNQIMNDDVDNNENLEGMINKDGTFNLENKEFNQFTSSEKSSVDAFQSTPVNFHKNVLGDSDNSKINSFSQVPSSSVINYSAAKGIFNPKMTNTIKFCQSARECNNTLGERCFSKGFGSVCDCERGLVRHPETRSCEVPVTVRSSMWLPQERFHKDLHDQKSLLYRQKREDSLETMWLLLQNNPELFLSVAELDVKGYDSGSLIVIWNLKVILSANETVPEIVNKINENLQEIVRNNVLENMPLNIKNATMSFVAINACLLKENNYCHENAECNFDERDGLMCTCKDGYEDRTKISGEICVASCTLEYCGDHGVCQLKDTGERHCLCSGWYIGAKCEISGIVVLCSFSAANVIIILIVLIFICVFKKRKRNDDFYGEDMNNFPLDHAYQPNRRVMDIIALDNLAGSKFVTVSTPVFEQTPVIKITSPSFPGSSIDYDSSFDRSPYPSGSLKQEYAIKQV